jgi:hypothetical protein
MRMVDGKTKKEKKKKTVFCFLQEEYGERREEQE